MKLKIIGALFTLTLLYAGIFFFSNKAPQKSINGKDIMQHKEEIKNSKKKGKNNKQPMLITKEELKKALEDKDGFIDISIKSLKAKFGSSISDIKNQLKLIRFRNFIKKHYPENWKKLFQKIIKGAFPDEAEKIFKLIIKMDEYNKWLATGENFSGMNYDEIKQALSDIRKSFFGDDAAKIWSEESKIDTVRDTIAILDKSTDTIDEKLEIFKNTVDEEYSTEKETLTNRKYNLATSFFNMNSVQKELLGLNQDDRLDKLNEIRKEIGYNQQEIEVMAKRDLKREKRWENGLNYMKERDALAKTYDGDDLDVQLNELREKYFKYEANTIAIEEKSGFYRYNRKRIFGRN
ncbi:MAG: hypothetical protein GY714_33170 [Desulfobacterales bacterium]|nr:hypothetical protein [Desulfobacterales bacterium]